MTPINMGGVQRKKGYTDFPLKHLLANAHDKLVETFGYCSLTAGDAGQ